VTPHRKTTAFYNTRPDVARKLPEGGALRAEVSTARLRYRMAEDSKAVLQFSQYENTPEHRRNVRDGDPGRQQEAG